MIFRREGGQPGVPDWPVSFHARRDFPRASFAGTEERGLSRRAEQGEHSSGRSWRGLCRMSPAFMRLFGADGVFFTASGKIFFNGEGKGGGGRGERHSPDACDDATARARSGHAACHL